jgi:hypothetical protein
MKSASAGCRETSNSGLHPDITFPCSWPASLKENQELRQNEANRRSFPRRGQSLRYRLDRRHPLQINAHKLPVHTISSHLKHRIFETSFQVATSSCRVMRDGVAQGGLISPVLFSLYVNEMPSPSHHVELAPYADVTAIIATSCKPTLPVSYLEA